MTAKEPLRELRIPAALTLLGLLLRLRFLDEPFRGDELFTFLNYVRLPAWVIVRLFDTPNNHPLFSLLAHALTSLFGLSELTLRLPALLPGLLLVPLTWRFVWAATRERAAAAMAALATATSHGLIYYSVVGRGYALQAALALWLAALWAEGRLDRPSPRAMATAASLGFLTLYCVPSGVVFLGPFIALVALRQCRGRGPGWRFLLSTAALAGAASLIAFLPLLDYLGELAPFARHPLPNSRFFYGLLELLSAGLMPPWALAAGLLLGSAAIARRPGPLSLFLALLAYLPLAAAADAAGAPGRFFERSYLPVFPFAYGAMAFGLLQAWRRCSPLLPSRGRRAAGAAALAVWAGSILLYSTALLRNPSSLYYPTRSEDRAFRSLLREFAPGLAPGEVVCGAQSGADALAAIYTIAWRGYGFYGLGPRWRERPPRRIYVLCSTEQEASAFAALHRLTELGYGPPRPAASRGQAVAFAIDRSGA